MDVPTLTVVDPAGGDRTPAAGKDFPVAAFRSSSAGSTTVSVGMSIALRPPPTSAGR